MARLGNAVRGVALLAIALASGLASAEIYRWVDASGRMHFTQDLGQVPASYRAAAVARAEAPVGRTPVQHYTPPQAPARIDRARRSRRGTRAGKSHQIRVARAGPSMLVTVRINDRLDVPFIIDTGATDVVLPMWAARELGLAVEGPGVRTSPRQTANGRIEAPVVMLDSVRLGTAVVEKVGGLALEQMNQGLLGLSFFNHFSYKIDAARGLLTLTENSLAEDGVLRAGRGRGQWQGEFRSAHRQIEFAKASLEEVPFGRSRARAAAKVRLAESVEKLRLLDLEADDARVPFPWRD